MGKPIIEFERIAVLRKIMKIPDARYKSGYREYVVLSESSFRFPKDVEGTQLSQAYLHKVGSDYERTDAFAEVSFVLKTRSTTV